MGSNCFTPIRGRRMRLTRVDNVGRPVYGACSSVTTSGFVQVDLSSETEDGEETTVTTAGGDICVAEKACDQLKWLTVEMQFCLVDPDLATLINPMWEKLYDYQGDTIGFAETYTQNCDTGFAMEIWCDVTGYVPQDPNAQGAWLYYLLPFVIGGAVGDETIENGALNLTLTGRTKKGNGWGKGPYPVMLNSPAAVGAVPVPGPLLTPVGADEPRRRFLTTVRPPQAQCGCQPLSAPNGPSFSLFLDPADTTRMTVKATPANAEGRYRVLWGDGSPEAELPLAGATHQYAKAGDYLVSVFPQGAPNQVRVTAITVGPDAVLIPQLHVKEDASETTDRRSVIATITHDGAVQLDWGDGTSASHPGDGSEVKHTYAAGSYTVTATDADDAKVFIRQDVVVPFGAAKPAISDPVITERINVEVTVDNHGNGPVSIDWGHGTPTENPGDGTEKSTHAYPDPGQGGTATDYTVTVTSKANSEKATKTVTIQPPAAQAAARSAK